jgi:hypothetical protein
VSKTRVDASEVSRRCLDCRHLGTNGSFVLNVWRPQACSLSRVIPDIDIWRAANLMLKRYGEKALEESATRADELAANGDHDSAVT